ncbi:metal-sulfur cluster assembly factor [Limosilactobacillus reuteri]|uniref:metal-sulfur cluster assembly factor n=1 Tax=Limosilactobacillus reuteri TaxID=1598 RepID=UPI001E544C00|nr:metal-sulfur cluster assembly factor [Limosilactobacillus reuteri]MCC4387626.1 metal-sulfur cluster assembly factor [Limosilactobacillus reuteri]MCC4393908.1 metal-sulfur cluster assembly factor [Limosilactobacillus reuteri]
MTDVQTSDSVADQIIKALQDVIDPELGIDLVNLGLIYGVDMTAEGVVTVRMTLTTMGCPITDVLQQMIDSALRKVEGVKKVQIEVVWEPAWTPDRMSRFAKIALGYHG